jgi:hypothetical protein
VLGDLAQVHKAEVRQAEVHVGEPRAGQIDRLEAEIGDDPGSQSVRRAGDKHAFFPFEQRTKRPNVGGGHRSISLFDLASR